MNVGVENWYYKWNIFININNKYQLFLPLIPQLVTCSTPHLIKSIIVQRVHHIAKVFQIYYWLWHLNGIKLYIDVIYCVVVIFEY
jgi:hypothetical protein